MEGTLSRECTGIFRHGKTFRILEREYRSHPSLSTPFSQLAAGYQLDRNGNKSCSSSRYTANKRCSRIRRSDGKDRKSTDWGAEMECAYQKSTSTPLSLPFQSYFPTKIRPNRISTAENTSSFTTRDNHYESATSYRYHPAGGRANMSIML